MEIRKITNEERKQYHKISQYAFGNWQDEEIKDENIKWMNPDDCFVIVDEGRMVSGMINHGLKQSIRGSVKRLSGIGNVATYPEYRNRGYIKALFNEVFKEMRIKKQCVSMLQPFKESFYQKFGYISTNREMNLRFHVSGLQHYLAEVPSDWSIERKTGSEAQKEFLKFFSKESLRWHGMVIYDEIPEGFKEHLSKDTVYILIKHDNVIKAACSYRKKDMKIIIRDIIWNDLNARKLIFNYFARHRDQVGDFQMSIPMGTNFFSWFQDMRSMYELKMCEGPWMVRIINVIEAFDDILVSGTGELVFQVNDEICGWNTGNYKLTIENNRTKMIRCQENLSVNVTCDIKGLNALLYGSLPINEIIDKGWLNADNEATLNTLERWFPTLLLFNTFNF